MDTLSDVLAALRVDGMLSTRFEGRGAWALRFPAYQHIKFGCVLSGRFYLWLEGQFPRAIETGDLYLLANGQPFCSASDPARTTQDGVAIIRGARGQDGIARYDGGGAGIPVSLTSGRFTFGNDAHVLLLRHLPPLIHLRAADIGTSALTSILELLPLESNGQRAGAAVARSSLAALALVHILRAWLAVTPHPAGWLGALPDARIGKALAAIHAEPGRRWTLDSLARYVAMSRTAFAHRFRALTGQPPLEYLRHWRMTLARAALRDTDVSLAELAARTGYLSDAAFSAAFKRSTGVSPGHFRAQGIPGHRRNRP